MSEAKKRWLREGGRAGGLEIKGQKNQPCKTLGGQTDRFWEQRAPPSYMAMSPATRTAESVGFDDIDCSSLSLTRKNGGVQERQH